MCCVCYVIKSETRGLCNQCVNLCCDVFFKEMAGFSFGLISDVQFAFVKDRVLPGTKSRHYQNSRKLLKEAISHLNDERDTTFVIHLGDIIDGVNKNNNSSQLALKTVLDDFDRADVDIKHVLGNHELYNFSRSELLKTSLHSALCCSSHCHASKNARKHLTIHDISSPPDAFYYTFTVKRFPNYRFIVLDTYDVSVLGRSPTSNAYKNAYNILRMHNVNEDLEDSTGMEGVAKRYIADNGGLGNVQMKWLDNVLSHADGCNQRVILFSHVPLHPTREGDTDILWNYEEVMDLVWSHKSVKVSLSGHLHEDRYLRDKQGIHHRTIAAVLEADKQSNAFATVHLTMERMIIEGHGEIYSQTFDIF